MALLVADELVDIFIGALAFILLVKANLASAIVADQLLRLLLFELSKLRFAMFF